MLQHNFCIKTGFNLSHWLRILCQICSCFGFKNVTQPKLLFTVRKMNFCFYLKVNDKILDLILQIIFALWFVEICGSFVYAGFSKKYLLVKHGGKCECRVEVEHNCSIKGNLVEHQRFANVKISIVSFVQCLLSRCTTRSRCKTTVCCVIELEQTFKMGCVQSKDAVKAIQIENGEVVR